MASRLKKDSRDSFQQGDVEFLIEIAMSQQKTWDARSLRKAIAATGIPGTLGVALFGASVPDADLVFQIKNKGQLASANQSLVESFS